LINNRQGGRRRGRGGQRPQNLGQPGNRQDNRQRGNAAQLLEKYKNMARDAQLAGDRVQSEYYLQFADHYYRVLGESRARFEEQRRQRGDFSDDEDDSENNSSSERSFAQDEEMAEAADEAQEERRPQREERQYRGNGRDRPARNGSRRPESSEDEERIAFDVLPPAIGASEQNEQEAEPEPKPRRRSRRPAADNGEGEIAPAA
jgi:hypothetical protein